TLLYLPRSMARMGAAAVAVVVIVQAPWGDGWWKCGNSHVTTPHGLHGFFRPTGQLETGHWNPQGTSRARWDRAASPPTGAFTLDRADDDRTLPRHDSRRR